MNLQTFLAEIRRYWKIFATVSGALFAVALGAILLTPATYVSNTELLVTVSGSTTAAAYQNDQVVAGRINSYIALLTTEAVNQRVVDKLKLPMTATELATNVSATNVPPKTSLIDVAVTDTSPERAGLLANTLANEFISYTDALETPTGEDSQKIRTTVVSAATQPHQRWVERVVLAVLGLLAALLVGSVAVWVRSRIDPVVRTAEEAETAAGVPVIATLATPSTLTPEDLEEYGRLGAQLESTVLAGQTPDERGRVWALTSAVGEVDVKQVAMNLGRALELAGSRVVVVESGAAHPLHDGAEGDGAEPVREDEDTVPDRSSTDSSPDDPGVAATGTKAGPVDELRDDDTSVIVIAPPVLSSDGASTIDGRAGATALVLFLETTKRKDLEQSSSNLASSGSPLAGLVVVVADRALSQTAVETPAADRLPSSAPTEGTTSYG